jgi:putative holliday junction resolvase
MEYKFKKYLGIDWGEKRIGLALGDDETKIASPFKVAGDIIEVLQVIKDEDINIIVLGLPLSVKNIEHRMSNEFMDFKKLLEDKAGVPIELADERLSSKAADALVGEKKTKAARDAVAAMLILQSFFDKHARNE